MKPYADTNFFTQRYLELAGSERGDRWLADAGSKNAVALPVTWLHQIELINAFQFSVWLARKGGHPMVSSQHAAIASATFRADLADKTFIYSARPNPDALDALFEDLSLRHTAKHGFRTYDILHVAIARILGCDTFWSFDLKARKLALLEGLTTPD